MCLKLASKPSWYNNFTLPELAKKAQQYMKQYTALSKTKGDYPKFNSNT